jgi:dihydroxy-acid dehydratase
MECVFISISRCIADSIETVVGAQWYDGVIAIPGCDKNMQVLYVAMGRLNRPSIMVYGGSIHSGKWKGIAQYCFSF